MAGIIAGLDIETTGLEASAGHKTIEVCVQLYQPDGTKRLDWTQRINPLRSISAEAERVHKIALSDLVACPEFVGVAPTMLKILAAADLIVAHNGVGFDIPFLNYELRANGLAPITKPVFDTCIQGRWSTYNGKIPNLGELCFACDIPYDLDAAHAASYDVSVMMGTYFRGAAWGFFDPAKAEVVR